MTTVSQDKTTARRRDVPAVRDAPVLLQIPDLTGRQAEEPVKPAETHEERGSAAVEERPKTNRATAAVNHVKDWLEKSNVWVASGAVVLVFGMGIYFAFFDKGKPTKDPVVEPVNLSPADIAAFEPAKVEKLTVTPTASSDAKSPAADRLAEMVPQPAQLSPEHPGLNPLGPADPTPSPMPFGLQDNSADRYGNAIPPNPQPSSVAGLTTGSSPLGAGERPHANSTENPAARVATRVPHYPGTDPNRYPDLSIQPPDIRFSQREHPRQHPTIEPPRRTYE